MRLLITEFFFQRILSTDIHNIDENRRLRYDILVFNQFHSYGFHLVLYSCSKEEIIITISNVLSG